MEKHSGPWYYDKEKERKQVFRVISEESNATLVSDIRSPQLTEKVRECGTNGEFMVIISKKQLNNPSSLLGCKSARALHYGWEGWKSADGGDIPVLLRGRKPERPCLPPIAGLHPFGAGVLTEINEVPLLIITMPIEWETNK